MSKYENAKQFSSQLTEITVENRPKCAEIIDEKEKLKLLLLRKDELVRKFNNDIEDFKSILLPMEGNIIFYIYNIIKTKLICSIN